MQNTRDVADMDVDYDVPAQPAAKTAPVAAAPVVAVYDEADMDLDIQDDVAGMDGTMRILLDRLAASTDRSFIRHSIPLG